MAKKKKKKSSAKRPKSKPKARKKAPKAPAKRKKPAPKKTAKKKKTAPAKKSKPAVRRAPVPIRYTPPTPALAEEPMFDTDVDADHLLPLDGDDDLP